MANQVVGPDPTPWFDALKYGPLGLAGLMLVLVIFALSVSKLEPARERILRLLLFIGSFCFVVSAVLAALQTYIGASHLVSFYVDPFDGGSKSDLPQPKIRINGGMPLDRPASYAVSSDVTAIVDVKDAVGAAEERAATIAKQQALLNSTIGLTQQAVDALTQSTDAIKSHAVCTHPNPDEVTRPIVAKNDSVLDALTKLQQAIRSPVTK